MSVSRSTLFASLLLCLCTPGAARQADMLVPPRVVLQAAGDAHQAAQSIHDAIVAGARAAGWSVTAEADGKVTLWFSKQGKHEIVVDIVYDATGYELRYVSSRNMNYEQRPGSIEIHPNYNRWITLLLRRIGLARP
jgi:hypothetical protein